MAFSYLSSDPGSSDRSWVRLRIGDNSSSSILLQDAEIDVLLEDYGSKYAAAAAACRSVGASFARQVEKQVGKLRIKMAEASNSYFEMADRLDREGDAKAGGVWVGGVSDADKKLQTDDTDWSGSSFSRGQFDYPGSGSNPRSG